jgi:hypothetical protein
MKQAQIKFLVSVLLIAILSFVAGLYLPWWTVSLAAFLVIAIIPQRPLYAFLTGFLAIFILWGLMALLISNANEHILAHKVSRIILKSDSPLMLVFVTAFIGALVSGCAALAASYMRGIEA